MWDLFLALFGIPYITTKYFKEIRTHKENERVATNKIDWENIKYKELAPSEEELNKAMLTAYYQTDKGILEVEDAIIRIFGTDYRNSISEAYKDVVNKSIYAPMPANFRFWIFQLMLAKAGKLDPKMKHHSYELGGGKLCLINIKFCEEIERYMHASGHSEMLLGSTIPPERLIDLEYVPSTNTMEWLCPGAWGRKRRLW